MDIRSEKLPFANETVDEVYVSGVLEQIGSNEQLIYAMNEMHRVLKIGGQMIAVVPNARFAIAHRDPMDIRKFTPETFSYFDSGKQEHALYGSVYGFCPWTDIRIEENTRHILTIHMTKCAQIK